MNAEQKDGRFGLSTKYSTIAPPTGAKESLHLV